MKIRTAAMVAVMTTAVTKVREYAREHPEQAGQAVDKVEDFVRGKAAPKHAGYIDKGSKALRQGLGIPLRPAGSGRPTAPLAEDPDPDTDEPWSPHATDDLRPLAPNPSPGTDDDPQPRRGSDDPAPMTPGEHLQP
ncbi:MAG TPA: antitoxin [Phycicoccus sp.]